MQGLWRRFVKVIVLFSVVESSPVAVVLVTLQWGEETALNTKLWRMLIS